MKETTNKDTAPLTAEDWKVQRRLNKFKSLRRELESGALKDFDQMFAIMSITAMAMELNISFYTFQKKVYSPREWTIGEIDSLAKLLGTKYSIVHEFIFSKMSNSYKPKRYWKPQPQRQST